MQLFTYLLSIPKSIYVCLRLLPFKQAIKLPILVSFRSRILSVNGSCIIPSPKFGLVKIGFKEIGLFDKRYNVTTLQINGIIEFQGKSNINYGSKLIVGKEGHLTIGKNFENSAGISIVCWNSITIGNNVLTSWETLLMDTDFHATLALDKMEKRNYIGSITIGDNVWICNKSMILKGSNIPNGVIVGAMSLVNKPFFEENCLICGNPARIAKKNITRCRQ